MIEQQVITEIDQLFQELIVDKISKRIEEINASLDSLLGDESEIQFKLKQIPSSGSVKSIVATQLQDLNDQADNIANALNAEKKKLSNMEMQVKAWLNQLATNTESQIEESEKKLREYSETAETTLLESIKENAINTENKIVTSLENVQSSVSSQITAKAQAVEEHLNALFLDDQSETSFKKYYDSSVQTLSDKINDCQELLEQINSNIGEISANVVAGNSFMEEAKCTLSSLVKKSESFSQKSDIAELQKAIEANARQINAISNTDVLEELQMFKIAVDARLDYFKKVSFCLMVTNVLTLLALISIIALSLCK